jgi:hypothetical protein
LSVEAGRGEEEQAFASKREARILSRKKRPQLGLGKKAEVG